MDFSYSNIKTETSAEEDDSLSLDFSSCRPSYNTYRPSYNTYRPSFPSYDSSVLMTDRSIILQSLDPN